MVYVDDLLIIGSTEVEKGVKRELPALLTVTDLGQCSYFLGIDVKRGLKGHFLSRSAYTLNLLESFGTSNCNPLKPELPLAHTLYDCSVHFYIL